MLLQREALLHAMGEPNLDDRLIVTPLLDKEQQVGPGSIDLRLGSGFIEVKRRAARVVDPLAGEDIVGALWDERFDIPIGESFFLHPGQFVLGATFEFVGMPKGMGGQVLGRSSWGRIGLIVATAVTVQPGYRGCLTLELQNLGSVPIKLVAGLRIAQLMVWRADGAVEIPYSDAAKYDSPLGPESSRIGWDAPEAERLSAIGRELRGGSVP